MITLTIATDFSKTPGLRYITQSKYSGEEFRETILKKKFLEAQEKDTKLMINLDGTEGMGPSFLEESFGGLAREYGIDEVKKRIEYIATEEPYLVEEILEYVDTSN